MKIAYLHGLESSINPEDPKIIWLNDNFKDAYTPTINYKSPGSFKTIFRTIKNMDPDCIVGSSMGGYFAYLIGSKLGIKTVLFNPAVVGRSFDPVVDDTEINGRSGHNLFLGKNDKVINGDDIRKFFGDSGMANVNTEYYSGGHRVPVDVFINSIKKVSGVNEIYNNIQNKHKVMKKFEQFVNEKTSFSQMKKDSKTKEYKEVSQAINNAEEVADIWNMLDPKMFKFTESEFEDIFDEWWNNISSYDSIPDFSRNASWEDAHSLYLHLLPYVSESVVTEGKTSAVYTDPNTGKKYDLQYVSTKKRWELDVMKKGASIYSSAITTIKRDTLAEIQEWLDGYNIDSSWTKGLSESVVTEKREDVGKYNTVKKVLAKLGRRPSEQELAQFITDNYYDVTEVERGDDDPSANDKIADLVGFYKFDIDDWEIAWADAQNESVITEAKKGEVVKDMGVWKVKTTKEDYKRTGRMFWQTMDNRNEYIDKTFKSKKEAEKWLSESEQHSLQTNKINESETVYHKYDFEGMWAQKLGMTREEYVAHFATMTAGVDEAMATDARGTQFDVKGINFTYTDVGRFYGVYLYDVPKTSNVQWRAKLSLSEITEFLRINNIKQEVPVRYDEKDLDKICKSLSKLKIVCDYDDSFDVS